VTIPAVSIGLPVYNGAATVGRAIGALLAQTFDDFELIVSDNGSTDATEQICRELADSDPRVRYVRHPRNRGPAANFAFVLDEARAPVFMWAAADDHWEPEFLTANLDLLRSDPRVVGSVSRVSMPGLADPGTRPLRGSFVRKVRQLVYEISGNSRFYGLFRTDVIRAALVEGAGAYIASDWSVIIAAARRGNFAEVDRVLMTRSSRGTSNTWRRQMASLSVRGVSRLLPLFGFTQWLWRNLSRGEFLACLDVIVRAHLVMTTHYAIEVLRDLVERRPSPSRVARPA
jgi:glycosyltransferase involved in cell wall biosynthesis